MKGGLRECGELVVLFPVELAAIHDDTTQRAAVTAQELRSRVHHDVCAMLQRTDQVRRAERIVHDEGDAVLVGYSSHTLQVEHVAVRVAESLGIYYFCVGFDGSLQSFEVIHIDYRVADALRSQRVGDEVIRTAIEVVGSHYMVARLHNVLQRIGDGGGTRGDSQSCHTALQGSHTVFKHTLRRVGQTTIDITRITETETVGGML